MRGTAFSSFHFGGVIGLQQGRQKEKGHMKREHLELITELRHRLHAWPELSLEEYQTKEILMEFIKHHTSLEVIDCGHWFYAAYRSGKPDATVVAFRADFDALPIAEGEGFPYHSQNPGVSHKCGHDGHSAVLAGLALEVDCLGTGKDIIFIFQHGEEIGAGGEECARLIPRQNISRIFAFHNMSGIPQGAVMVRTGITQCASKGLTVCFQGTPAHASQPETGKNPSSAIAKLALYTEAETKRNGYEGLVMATIVQMTAGSKNFGISAYQGELSMTLRTFYENDMRALEAAIRRYSGVLAQEDGLSVSFLVNDAFPETVNDADSVILVQKAAAANGNQIVPMDSPFRASEDFGYYLKQCPGAMFYIGNGEAYPELHTEAYDFNDGILDAAVELFKRLIEF